MKTILNKVSRVVYQFNKIVMCDLQKDTPTHCLKFSNPIDYTNKNIINTNQFKRV